ncbi:putative T7SS-secreted protein [Cellulomonas sp. URHB0016]
MTRPLSWYPLAGFDPVPGDPEEVRQASRAYTTVAEAIEGAATGLESVTGSDQLSESQALDAVHTQAKAVAADIRKAHKRYQAVAEALAGFADPLDHAQAESLTALAEARAAQRAIDEAHHTLRTTDWGAAPTSVGGTSLVPVDNPGLAALRAGLSDADRALDRARERLADAVQARDAAAARAVAHIEHITGGDGLHDSVWRNVLHVTHWVSDVFGAISMWAGAMALLLCWVPIVGEVLGAVALVAGAVALVADVVLLFSGEGDVLDVVFGALGIMTFGLGRVVGAGLKITIRGARATEVSATAGRGAAAAKAGKAATDVADDVQTLARPVEGTLKDLGSAMPDGAAAAPVATRALSRAGAQEMAASLKPSAVMDDLAETFRDVRAVRPGTFKPTRSQALGAVIGDVDSAEWLTNLDKAAGNGSREAAHGAAADASARAIAAVAGGIALDKALLGASTAHDLFPSNQAVSVDTLHLNH